MCQAGLPQRIEWGKVWVMEHLVEYTEEGELLAELTIVIRVTAAAHWAPLFVEWVPAEYHDHRQPCAV